MRNKYKWGYEFERFFGLDVEDKIKYIGEYLGLTRGQVLGHCVQKVFEIMARGGDFYPLVGFISGIKEEMNKNRVGVKYDEFCYGLMKRSHSFMPNLLGQDVFMISFWNGYGACVLRHFIYSENEERRYSLWMTESTDKRVGAYWADFVFVNDERIPGNGYIYSLKEEEIHGILDQIEALEYEEGRYYK